MTRAKPPVSVTACSCSRAGQVASRRTSPSISRARATSMIPPWPNAPRASWPNWRRPANEDPATPCRIFCPALLPFDYRSLAGFVLGQAHARLPVPLALAGGRTSLGIDGRQLSMAERQSHFRADGSRLFHCGVRGAGARLVYGHESRGQWLPPLTVPGLANAADRRLGAGFAAVLRA